MAYVGVKLKKPIEREELVSALEKAAQDIGWKSRIEEKFRGDYILGSKEIDRVLERTLIYLRKPISIFRGQATIDISAILDGPVTTFSIFTGFSFGSASKYAIENYLKKVSAHL